MRRLILCMIAFLTTCASPNPSPAPRTPTVTVTNTTWNLMRVYTGTDGTMVRVGEVETSNTARFAIRNARGGFCGVTLVALATEARWDSGPFLCAPGDAFEVKTGALLSTTMIVLRQ